MQESPFVKIFEEVAKEIQSDLIVERGANLFYQLQVNKKLELNVEDLKNPKRGQSAFQTDICLFEEIDGVKLPRIAIEFKTNISTHDILTYSTKAGKHKGIYPFLRYGMLSSEIDSIPSRFFLHNEHLDFFIAGKNYKNESVLKNLISELIKKELAISHTLDDIYFEKKKFDFYRTDVIFENFSKDT